jgi:hypothetical protein
MPSVTTGARELESEMKSFETLKREVADKEIKQWQQEEAKTNIARKKFRNQLIDLFEKVERRNTSVSDVVTNAAFLADMRKHLSSSGDFETESVAKYLKLGFFGCLWKANVWVVSPERYPSVKIYSEKDGEQLKQDFPEIFKAKKKLGKRGA